MTSDRICQMRTWMRENNVTFTWLAEQFGISGQAMGQCLRAKHMPMERRERLKSLGFPEEFLPPAGRLRGRAIPTCSEMAATIEQ